MTPADDGPALVALPGLDAAGRGRFEHLGRGYAVFTTDGGELVVVDDSCPHKGGPLSEGLLRDGAVVCPWHWYTFDLASGTCRNADAAGLRRHPVVVVDGVAHAAVTPPPRRDWAATLRAHARPDTPLS